MEAASEETAASTPALASSSTGLMPNTYSNAFVKGSPREGMQKIQNRLSKAKILTDELADYFAARRDLENSYLKALGKIAKRSFLSDPTALGPNFLPVYERLVSEIGELASIHGELEKKLEVDCEVPLRNITNKGEWSRIKDHDEGLSSTLREINLLETQLAKDQKKVEGASSKKAGQASQKVAETEKTLKQTLDLWETEAPFAFEAYQRIDAQRLETMKEVITKFETARSDAAQRLMGSTEQSMQVVLNFDPQADMQEFALKNATSKERDRGGPSSFSRPATSTPTRSGASASLNRRGSMGASTLLGRNTSHTSTASPGPGQTNGVNEFGSRVQSSSASMHSNDRGYGAGDQGTPSRTLGSSTLKSALTRFGRGRSNKNTNDTQTVYGNLPESADDSPMRPPAATRGTSGTDYRHSFDSRSDVGTPTGAANTGKGNLMTPLSPTRIGGTSSSTPATTTSAPKVDAEGYSIPPPDRKPWEIPEITKASSIMDDDEDGEGRDTLSVNTPSKVTGMSIARAPIAENADQDQAALERMKSTLLTSRTPSSAPQRRNTANRRDRRDVRNTTYGSSMNLDDGSTSRSSTFGIPSLSTSPIASPLTSFTGVPATGSHRTQSMMSSGSMSQLGSVGAQSNEIATGLNATITERVNVVFSGRDISKMMIVGEVAVSAKDVTSSSSPLHLRIESFEQLEKAAPNPAYLKEAGSPGEYHMDLNTIMSQTSTTAGKVTLLKYQLHISADKWTQYVPLNLSAQWRCEDHQTSILINYSANGESLLSQRAAISPSTIQDLSLSVDITSSGVSNIMSKPIAFHSIEQKKLIWKISEAIDLNNTGTNKALARFQVNQKSQATSVEAKWKIVGISLSTLGLSIVDSSDGIQFGEVSRQLQSGKYTVNP